MVQWCFNEEATSGKLWRHEGSPGGGSRRSLKCWNGDEDLNGLDVGVTLGTDDFIHDKSLDSSSL